MRCRGKHSEITHWEQISATFFESITPHSHLNKVA
jgi:hypothetical protein